MRPSTRPTFGTPLALALALVATPTGPRPPFGSTRRRPPLCPSPAQGALLQREAGAVRALVDLRANGEHADATMNPGHDRPQAFADACAPSAVDETGNVGGAPRGAAQRLREGPHGDGDAVPAGSREVARKSRRYGLWGGGSERLDAHQRRQRHVNPVLVNRHGRRRERGRPLDQRMRLRLERGARVRGNERRQGNARPASSAGRRAARSRPGSGGPAPSEPTGRPGHSAHDRDSRCSDRCTLATATARLCFQ